MSSSPTRDTSEPVIVAASVAPGHDGLAEALIQVRYPNGATRSLSLPIDAIEGALDAAGVTGLDQLIGRAWTTLSLGAPPCGPRADSQPALTPEGAT